MKEIKILGTGCAKCKSVAEMVRKAAVEQGVDIDLEKVEEMARIVAYGVMSTPAVVVDGRVVHAGGVPEADAVAAWLRA